MTIRAVYHGRRRTGQLDNLSHRLIVDHQGSKDTAMCVSTFNKDSRSGRATFARAAKENRTTFATVSKWKTIIAASSITGYV